MKKIPLFFLITGIAAVGYAGSIVYLAGKLEFREEVQLADEQIVQIRRVVKTSSLGEIGGPGGWQPKYMSVEIVSPTLADNPPKWENVNGLVPMVFDRDPQTKEWTLLATFYMCEDWVKLGKPKLPYAEFKVRNHVWQQMEISPKWIGRPANVLTGISSGGEPSLITLSAKQLRIANSLAAPKYVKIINDWRNKCS